MRTLIVYEAGVRLDNGRYTSLLETPEEAEVDKYIEIMKTTASESSLIMKSKKTYLHVCTIPHIIPRG